MSTGDAYDLLEADVNEYLDGYEAAGGRRISYVVRNPVRALRVVRSIRRLQPLQVATSDTVEGRAVRRELSRGLVLPRSPLHAVAAAIAIPGHVDEFLAGATKQTLRRQVRAAEQAGVTWEAVTDPATRRGLIELCDEHERTNERARYRAAHPSNQDLLEYDLWLLARSADGTPLLLSVTPVDSGLAALRYFRTLVTGAEASAARYLMTQALVETLSSRGVHHLVDTTLSLHLSHGLRHFQRMVGFRLIRLDHSRSRPKAVAARPEPEAIPGRFRRMRA